MAQEPTSDVQCDWSAPSKVGEVAPEGPLIGCLHFCIHLGQMTESKAIGMRGIGVNSRHTTTSSPIMPHLKVKSHYASFYEMMVDYTLHLYAI